MPLSTWGLAKCLAPPLLLYSIPFPQYGSCSKKVVVHRLFFSKKKQRQMHLQKNISTVWNDKIAAEEYRVSGLHSNLGAKCGPKNMHQQINIPTTKKRTINPAPQKINKTTIIQSNNMLFFCFRSQKKYYTDPKIDPNQYRILRGGAGCARRFRSVPEASGARSGAGCRRWFRKVPEGCGQFGCRAECKLQRVRKVPQHSAGAVPNIPQAQCRVKFPRVIEGSATFRKVPQGTEKAYAHDTATYTLLLLGISPKLITFFRRVSDRRVLLKWSVPHKFSYLPSPSFQIFTFTHLCTFIRSPSHLRTLASTPLQTFRSSYFIPFAFLHLPSFTFTPSLLHAFSSFFFSSLFFFFFVSLTPSLSLSLRIAISFLTLKVHVRKGWFDFSSRAFNAVYYRKPPF